MGVKLQVKGFPVAFAIVFFRKCAYLSEFNSQPKGSEWRNKW